MIRNIHKAIFLVFACLQFACEAPIKDKRAADELKCEAGTSELSVYPENYTLEMRVSSPIYPFKWQNVIDLKSEDNFPLDLASVFCLSDQKRDWSVVKQLLFISVPAW